MTWTPSATVTIAGTDYAGDTIETVRITRGREDVYSEPRAGYVLAELIDLDGTGFPFDILDEVVVTIDDSAGSPQTVFTGRISDWAANLYDSGFESGVARSVVTIIATGPLARLNRRNVGAAGRAAEKDGDRVAFLVASGLSASWEETGGTWGNVATAATTWGTIDTGYDPARIETPGVFDIAALPAEAGGYNPLTEGYVTALSGRGVLWDDPEGYVAYQAANARQTAAEGDYLPLPAATVLAGGLSPDSNQADVVNRVSVAFDGGAVIYSSEESILTYGVQATEFETRLADSSNAEAWALDYLEDHQGPTINLSSVNLRLDLIADDTLRDDLIGIDVNAPVVLEDLPATLGITQLPAFVEGVNWTIGRDTVGLNLFVSDAELSIGSIRWGLVAQTLTWADVPATLSWQDARSI